MVSVVHDPPRILKVLRKLERHRRSGVSVVHDPPRILKDNAFHFVADTAPIVSVVHDPPRILKGQV